MRQGGGELWQRATRGRTGGAATRDEAAVARRGGRLVGAMVNMTGPLDVLRRRRLGAEVDRSCQSKSPYRWLLWR